MNHYQYSFENVFTYKNLYKAYICCRKGVSWKASVQKFTANAALNVNKIYNQLKSGEFKSPGFYEFDIFERGKHRHIKSVAISERIVQRCLCDNCLVPLLTKSFINDNGACQKGKGYDFAIKRMHYHLLQHIRTHQNNGYILTFDFSKYFDNIPHDLIKSILIKNIKDEKILALTIHFVDAFGPVGLGLGSQISQVLAMAAVNRLDHYIKENLKIKFYGRYMDDGYLISDNKYELQKCLQEIRKICNELGIKLNEKKTQIRKLKNGFVFLKVRHSITVTGKIIRKPSKAGIVRARRKISKLRRYVDSGKLTVADVAASVQSYCGHNLKFNAYRTICSMWAKFNEIYGGIYHVL